MSDPVDQYTAPVAEWAALLALAAEKNPAQTIADLEWDAALFASAGAAEAFAQVQGARAPVSLSVPKAHDAAAREMLAESADALDELRTTLGRWATVRRALPAISASGRQTLEIARAAIARGEAPDLGALVQGLQGALDDAMAFSAGSGEVRATLGTLASRYWEQLAEHKEAAPTGLGPLDDKLGDGFQPRRLVALLGAPGSGKTSLANQIAEHIASGGRPVVYLTTEDTPQALLCKTIARIGDLDYGAAQRGIKTQEQRIKGALAQIALRESATRLLYLDTFSGLGRLRAIARGHFARYAAGGHGLLVVDYLQRVAHMQPDAQGQELRLRVSALTSQLRELAKQLDCTVLALASQNRSAYAGRGGDALASAKESGDIEYSCDVLMALERDEQPEFVPPHEARVLKIPKNRQGDTGRPINLDWYGSRQTFTPVVGDWGE